MLTEREAWLRAEEEWRRPVCGDVEEDITKWVSSTHNNGLCMTIYRLWQDGFIGLRVVRRMEKKIRKHMETADPRHIPFGWPDTRDGAIARADFCRRQAEMLKTEGATT